MPRTFTEANCKIEFNGQEFAANGAVVTEDRIVCYAKKPANAIQQTLINGQMGKFTQTSGWTFTDWHNNRIGSGAVTGTWRVGPYRTKMFSFIVRLPDGRRFNCRGQGDGMVATGKLAKG